jgi:hypothetical protein
MVAACARTIVTEREVVRQPIIQQQPVIERVTVVQPPAAPAEQIPPAPSATGYSWIAGHYEPKNRSYPGAASVGGGVGRAKWPTMR